ncbi:putative diguanylate cyclase [Magnetospirillum sp. XM-1]|uniref:diguanylate cyclase domain-containing protein n=1 Tax=Magnetospirillum sp. XM-1 TaxID=1663591 RepID=UPI00073E0F5C|nr:diguanylate cyclase [Magnetospirillum sp. XM-1]CUW41032.1 putative diguanylate cyclase [Magnetospirillum sp. XM-1]
MPSSVAAVAGTGKVSVDHELLELVSALVCILRQGEVVFINQAGVKVLGLGSQDDAIGTAFVEFVEADYRFLVEAGWELLAEEEFLPLKLMRRDGTLFEAEIRVRLIPGPEESFLVEARDISKFVKSAEALREREERLQGVLASVAEGIITVDEHGLIETANPAAERMFGHPKGKLVGKHIGVLMGPDMQDQHQALFAQYLAGSAKLMGRSVESMGYRADGTHFPMEISVSELRYGKGRLFTSILRDISERKENEERIKRLAHHDTLTGLPNRNLLNDRISHALARVRRHGGRMAVLYVDLDKFKPINDTLGHEAGDAVLREVARRLNNCVRSSDTVSRVGGDEFVVVVEEIGRPGEAAMVARKIIETLGSPIFYNEHACQVGASIGIAVFPDDGNTMDEVSKAADVAMYRVKHSGRNGYCFYSDAMPADEIDLAEAPAGG